MLRYKLPTFKHHRPETHLGNFAIRLLVITGLMLNLTNNVVLADQYKSFVIIDQPDKPSNLLATPELLAKNLDKVNQSQRAMAERFLARHFVEKKQYKQAINFYLQALTNNPSNSNSLNSTPGSLSNKPNSATNKKSLSGHAKRQLLDELSHIYLLDGQYQQVLDTLNKFSEISKTLNLVVNDDSTATQLSAYQLKKTKRVIKHSLMRAQAQFYLNQYPQATLTLNKSFNQAALNTNRSLTGPDVEQALYLYYHMQAHQPAVACLNYLLTLTPDNKSYWQTLTYLYQKMKRPETALNTLVLAEKQLTRKTLPTKLSPNTPLVENDTIGLSTQATNFDQANYDWLISLYVENKLYFQAATKFSQLIEQQRYPDNGHSYYQLFSLWFHAKEFDLSLNALKNSARLQQSSEYYIQLGQLHLQQNNWIETQEAVLSACKIGLNDKQVGMANLLLGVQFAHRGEREQAKLAFYNANLMGGTITESAQWLRYLNNGKAERNVDPYRRFTGPCLPKSEIALFNLLSNISLNEPTIAQHTKPATDKNNATKAPVKIALTTALKTALKTTIKTTPAGYFYGAKIVTTADDMESKIFSYALRINKGLMRKQKKSNGSLQMLIDSKNFYQDNKMHFTLAMPTRSRVMRTTNILPIKMPQYRAYSYIYTGDPSGTMTFWQKLYQHAIEQGEQPSDNNRLIFLERNDNGELQLELQLGLLE